METTEFTASYDMPQEDIKRIINEILRDHYLGKQRLMNEGAITDAVNHVCEIVDFNTVNPKDHDNLKKTAVAMYMYGFHRAFEFYIQRKDIFNLERNDKPNNINAGGKDTGNGMD